MSEDLIDTLCSVLCPTLTRPQAGALLAACVPLRVSPGEAVFEEGRPGTGLFFLVSGEAEVLKRRPDGGEQALSRVSAPSLLGEVSLITEGPHSATVRAVEACEFRFLSNEQIRRRLASDDLAAHRLMGSIALVLARRLMRLSDEILVLEAGADDRGRPEALGRVRERLFADWRP